ncbi:putative fumarate reductase/succinate dehydrogenase [Acidocella aquatica]|uniref:Fumarate reductase/succinate dehydrogenase n=1 Tax=Acidocella aquatica TaxID=1922313 RepID=A0ABQ6A7H8_9PROT|nr:FAD-dependent oxidoreductase [Acidocella aquatica]GLR66074.1 putative fumarate reductase/succinate dehydrogenase [Acidocella aquatica]
MDARPEHPVQAASIAAWDKETDVAVLGFGIAGACAALEAARAGAAVTIFEAAGGSGGASALSGGEIYVGGSGGTDIQNQNGFTDTTEDFATYLAMAGGQDPDMAKIALYASEAVNHFNWLRAQGVPYKGSFLPGKIIEPEGDDTLIWSGSEEAWPFVTKAKPAPRGHTVQSVGWGGGRKIIDILEARAREAGVQVETSARGRALVVENGAVAGVIIRQNGKELAVHARRGVLLATGGFCMNTEMIRQHAPEALRCSSPLGTIDDGSGILMGQAVGGRAIHMNEFFVTCPWYPPESLVKGIFINQAGQRFINEDCYHGRVMRTALEQQGDRVFLLCDNAIFARPLELAGAELAAVGESWGEVESELGFCSGTLSRAIAQYNEHAARGEDPVWHKAAKWLQPLAEPPFAALAFIPSQSYFSYFTLGGLETLPTGEVLALSGEPIAGLYAAGRAACGLPRWGKGYSSGLSLADSSFFGRLAGKAAAKAPKMA